VTLCSLPGPLEDASVTSQDAVGRNIRADVDIGKQRSTRVSSPTPVSLLTRICKIGGFLTGYHVGYSPRKTSTKSGRFRFELRPVTPEAAGSGPVAPANYLPVRFFTAQLIAVTSGAPAGGRSVHTPHA
jgi:hypothetical protein